MSKCNHLRFFDGAHCTQCQIDDLRAQLAAANERAEKAEAERDELRQKLLRVFQERDDLGTINTHNQGVAAELRATIDRMTVEQERLQQVVNLIEPRKLLKLAQTFDMLGEECQISTANVSSTLRKWAIALNLVRT